jgi:cation diffusion facilitator family transporter
VTAFAEVCCDAIFPNSSMQINRMTRACTSSKKIVILALVGNVLVAMTKVGAAAITGSSSMVSEAVHSVVDTVNEALLLHGYRQAARRPDPVHPLGYGRELYFWSFIVALMVFTLGAGVALYEGMQHIISPHRIEHASINYAVLALSFVFEGTSWLAAVRKLRETRGLNGYWDTIHRSKDPPSFMVLFEDSAALIGILTAALGIFLSEHFDQPVFDGIASLVIGLVLAIVAMFLASESKSLLIGERAAPGLTDAAVKLAECETDVLSAHSGLTVHLAPQQIMVALSVQFSKDLTTPEIEGCVERIETRICNAHPEIVTVFIKPQTQARFVAWKSERFGSSDPGDQTKLNFL